MRQIVSLIKDNQAHFALVDDESGDMIPFADLLIPDPDRFGLHESALLGTNLIQALGLNGTKRPKVTIPRVGDVSISGSDEEQLALVEPTPAPPTRTETPKEKRRRLQRENYARKHGRTRQPSTKGSNTSGKGGAARFITLDEVIAVINQYPEGITTAEIAERLWRKDSGGVGTMPDWYKMSIGNRQTMAEQNMTTKGVPLPYRVEYRPFIGVDGTPTNKQTKYLLPVAAPPPQPPPVDQPPISFFGQAPPTT